MKILIELRQDGVITALYDEISNESFTYDSVPYLLEDLGFVLECEVSNYAKKNEKKN